MSDPLPDPGAGFSWDESADALVLRPDAGVRAAFTTRLGGISPAPYDTLNLSFVVGDGEDRVRGNRERAGATIERDGRWSVVRQVHGAEVVRAEPPGGTLADADAQWTDDPGRTVAVLTADCVPLLLAGEARVGVVHAGWRGLVGGVIGAAVSRVGPASAFAGPAIGPCCYEVGADVRDRFPAAAVTDPRHVDLWTAAELACASAGVSAFRAARLCTSCNAGLFFSHRRDRGRTGRQALIAGLP